MVRIEAMLANQLTLNSRQKKPTKGQFNVMGVYLTDEQRVYNHVAMHILHYGLAEGFSDNIAQDTGVSAEIVRSLMRRWESEGRLTKSRCCPDCDALYRLSDQEFPIKMLVDGRELEGGSFIDGRRMAMLEGEWVELPMPSRIYVPLDLPHMGTRLSGETTLPLDPDEVDMNDLRAKLLEAQLYPEEFTSDEIKPTAEEQSEIEAKVDAEYGEAERQIEAERERRAAGLHRYGLGTIVFRRSGDAFRF